MNDREGPPVHGGYGTYADLPADERELVYAMEREMRAIESATDHLGRSYTRLLTARNKLLAHFRRSR